MYILSALCSLLCNRVWVTPGSNPTAAPVQETCRHAVGTSRDARDGESMAVQCCCALGLVWRACRNCSFYSVYMKCLKLSTVVWRWAHRGCARAGRVATEKENQWR